MEPGELPLTLDDVTLAQLEDGPAATYHLLSPLEKGKLLDDSLVASISSQKMSARGKSELKRKLKQATRAGAR